ncbi:MAG TPA: BMP family ABC transporter substrate-binding protein, partial [Caldimonas sp.]|nr:BMP family ABC transporter substrate-binding protein [Caldimonas sp.]
MSRSTMLQNLKRGGAPSLRSAVAFLVLAVLAVVTSASTPTAADRKLVVGFVYVTPIGEAGWTYQHELGRRAMQQALGSRVRTIAVESVAEGADAERVMRDLVAQGAGLIFATSFGYLEPALRVAADFPNVRFEHAGGYRTAPNLATYDARYYEARWLAGYLAGATSKAGIAGYVAGFPVPEVVQGINAFTLGMRAANPKAQVRVIWLGTWFDPTRERDAAQSLIDHGADV